MPTRTSPHGPIGFEARQGAARPPRPVTTRFISLLEFFWLAEQVTGIDADVLETPRSINLADSALHGPQASFGGQDFTRT